MALILLVFEVVLVWSYRFMNLLPMITMSACFAASFAWAGVEIPNPRASGRFMCLRTFLR